MISSRDLIERDRARLLNTITQTVAGGQRYALIDFPDYPNVGDTAIWLGTMRLLTERMGREPSYVCDQDYNKEQMVAAIGGGPIFLQGGGNFSDIYPYMQAYKNRIISDNPERQIIQMPQSIHFRDERNAAETRAVLKAHPDYWILVRDHRSAAFCHDVLDVPATLAPDAAFGLGPIHHPLLHPKRVVALMRADYETVPRDLSLLGVLGTKPVDWLTDSPGFDAETKRASVTRALLTGQVTHQRRRMLSFKARAAARLNRGVSLLTSGGTVLTDRLHAHILSVLLGMPNVCLDNDYGKIHSYIDAFTGDWAGVRKAQTLEEAVEMVRGVPLAERAAA